MVAAITFANPGNGLLIVAGLTPLGYMLATRVTDAYPARVTEAIGPARATLSRDTRRLGVQIGERLIGRAQE